MQNLLERNNLLTIIPQAFGSGGRSPSQKYIVKKYILMMILTIIPQAFGRGGRSPSQKYIVKKYILIYYNYYISLHL